MNRRSFLSALTRLGTALAASPLMALMPDRIKQQLPYPNWRNYTDCYTNVSRVEIIAKMRKATKQMVMMPPIREEESVEWVHLGTKA